jgi:hypothetical protein
MPKFRTEVLSHITEQGTMFQARHIIKPIFSGHSLDFHLRPILAGKPKSPNINGNWTKENQEIMPSILQIRLEIEETYKWTGTVVLLWAFAYSASFISCDISTDTPHEIH